MRARTIHGLYVFSYSRPLEEIVVRVHTRDRRTRKRAYTFTYSRPRIKGKEWESQEAYVEMTGKFPLSLLSPRRVKSFCHNGDKSDPLYLALFLSHFSSPPSLSSLLIPERCRRYACANAYAIMLFM